MTAPAPLDLPALLDDLERAHAAATPGPWAEWDSAVVNPATPARDVFVECDHHADAALIVAAVNALPTLIAELRKRDAALRAVDELVDEWDTAGDARHYSNLIAKRTAARALRAALTAALTPESVPS